MSRDSNVFLKDILNAIKRIEEYTKDCSFQDFREKQLIQDGVVRNLEIIGEAVKHLPKEIQKKNPTIEWKKIAGLRDILIHAYFGIEEEIVWDVITQKIPVLKKQVVQILTKKKK